MSTHLTHIVAPSCVENQDEFNGTFYPKLAGKMEFCNIPFIVSNTSAQELSSNHCHLKKSIDNRGADKDRRREKRVIPATIKRNRQLRRNARERERQSRLNNAFDVLRGVIPDYLTGKGPERKLTQIETLRLAQHYIMALTELLQEPHHCYGHSNLCGENSWLCMADTSGADSNAKFEEIPVYYSNVLVESQIWCFYDYDVFVLLFCPLKSQLPFPEEHCHKLVYGN